MEVPVFSRLQNLWANKWQLRILVISDKRIEKKKLEYKFLQ